MVFWVAVPGSKHWEGAELGRIPVLGSVGYGRDLPVPGESHSDLF